MLVSVASVKFSFAIAVQMKNLRNKVKCQQYMKIQKRVLDLKKLIKNMKTIFIKNFEKIKKNILYFLK